MSIDHEASSGNIFADLDLPEAEQELVKAKLTVQIYRLLKDQGLSPAEAAKFLGTTQTLVSALMRCKPASLEKLIKFLIIISHNIELLVKLVNNHRVGHISVVAQPVF